MKMDHESLNKIAESTLNRIAESAYSMHLLWQREIRRGDLVSAKIIQEKSADDYRECLCLRLILLGYSFSEATKISWG
jgi:hypothetical protein